MSNSVEEIEVACERHGSAVRVALGENISGTLDPATDRSALSIAVASGDQALALAVLKHVNGLGYGQNAGSPTVIALKRCDDAMLSLLKAHRAYDSHSASWYYQSKRRLSAR